ncbi:SLBB domain-containing protein [Geomonas sp. RF6]|uniref:SLBB domain-containing protein n=1 Tax=Geomonas sp. RF6 TaxID=2897342 RepID=UPI001E54BC77|nr:SLBB domain-containing protein [Geomonas sp. RF6]UFS69924.1 SLBB domain-containing protein [Geomonas sp. RF6]
MKKSFTAVALALVTSFTSTSMAATFPPATSPAQTTALSAFPAQPPQLPAGALSGAVSGAGLTLRSGVPNQQPQSTVPAARPEPAPPVQPQTQPSQRGSQEQPVAQAGGQGTPAENAASQPEQRSPLERALAEDVPRSDKVMQSQQFQIGEISQFGYSFFRPDSTGFAPQTDVPVGPEYVVGAGDRLVVNIWGSFDGSYELEVGRGGEIVLPRGGAVKVAGLPFGSLPDLFRAKLGRTYRDFQLSVTMAKTRLIKVYVVGQVNAPGDYTVSSMSTLINALSAAGGPTKNGSLRNIKINRNGKVIDTVDLYDFFLKGNKGRDIRLQPGDTVLVPVIGPVAGVAGNVRRPALYELKGERTLKELLELADGINPTGYLQRVQLSRVQAHAKKVVQDVSLDPQRGKSVEQVTAGIAIQDMDMVKIFPIDNTMRDYVRLEGYLLRPGDYALAKETRLSSLLKAAEPLPEYYAAAGQITRLYPPDLHPEIIYFNVDRAMSGDPEHDLALAEFDKVKVFARWEMEELPTVRVSGEVQKPGTFRLFNNMTVRDLLMQAGNVKATAYLKNAEITRLRRSGSAVTSYSVTVDLASVLKGEGNQKLEPFDELYVRRIPNWAEETDRYITLKGEFVFPGSYPIYRGERLSSVIRRAGGFTDKAFLRGAKFLRTQVRELQQKRMDEMLQRTEAELLKKQGELSSQASSKEELEATKASIESMMKSIDLLKEKKAEGRLVIHLKKPQELEGTPFDLEANGGDVIEVPSDPQTVSVLGQVFNPTSFVYTPGDNVQAYLKRSGGLTREAETRDIYLIKADGSVVSRQSSGGGFLGFGGFLSKALDSGDTVVVPQRMEKVAWMRDLKDIATILGQIAVTAGVVLAAGL